MAVNVYEVTYDDDYGKGRKIKVIDSSMAFALTRAKYGRTASARNFKIKKLSQAAVDKLVKSGYLKIGK
jgi:hypothetical protein